MVKTLIDFEQAQPFAVRFFYEALSNRHLANTFLLRGKDLATMYRMVLRLAQIINCEARRPLEACGQCTSCKWLEGNRHPGFITISNLTYLEEVDAEGKSKPKSGTPHKSIVVGQLDNLLKELSLQCPGFHRIVVLSGADEYPLEEGASSPFPPPADWRAPAGKQFVLQPLDKKLFPDTVSNKFLKTLEEPPANVLFFLLSDSEEKLLETIVSRCQTVPFSTPAGFNRITISTPVKAKFHEVIQILEQKNWMQAHAMLSALEEETGNTMPQLLDQLQQYIWETKNSPMPANQFRAAHRHLRLMEKTKRMLKDKVRPDAVLDHFTLHWTTL